MNIIIQAKEQLYGFNKYMFREYGGYNDTYKLSDIEFHNPQFFILMRLE